ncbi:hypothetical protein GUJ93_ZPchr0013g35252 [Zizania palustris]|uniref:Uncharacterized protein n=1 Tax=Zizania palustris TaxID=103762 RepID=A0A8J5X367_ZIZPA|nr:hypothetical protein GUJ93_ZPchr0013g35252 [Zizania palustris]
MSARALRKRRRLAEIGGGDLRAVGESQILSQRARRHHGHVPAAGAVPMLALPHRLAALHWVRFAFTLYLGDPVICFSPFNESFGLRPVVLLWYVSLVWVVIQLSASTAASTKTTYE